MPAPRQAGGTQHRAEQGRRDNSRKDSTEGTSEGNPGVVFAEMRWFWPTACQSGVAEQSSNEEQDQVSSKQSEIRNYSAHSSRSKDRNQHQQCRWRYTRHLRGRNANPTPESEDEREEIDS